jgi:hypothetical protein
MKMSWILSATGLFLFHVMMVPFTGKLEQTTTTTTNGNEDVLKPFLDALTWLRSMSSSGGGAHR